MIKDIMYIGLMWAIGFASGYLLGATPSYAQVTYYTNDWGKDMGTSYTLANTTTFVDAGGREVWSATTLAPAPVYVPINTVVPVPANYVPALPAMPGLPPLLPVWGAK